MAGVGDCRYGAPTPDPAGELRRRGGRPRTARRRDRADADAVLAGAVGARRRPGLPQVREPAAGRLVQDPRRVRADRPAERGGAGPRRGRGERGQPRPGGGARLALLGAQATVYMPEGAPLPKVAATRAYGAEVVFAGHDRRRGAGRGQEYAERDRRGVHPPVRPSGHRGRAGHGRPGDPRPAARGGHDRAGDRRRRARGRGRARGQVAAARVRMVGVQAENAAAFPLSLAAGRPVTVEPARRWPTASRWGAPATSPSSDPLPGRPGGHGAGGDHLPGAAALPRARQARGRAGRGGGGGRPARPAARGRAAGRGGALRRQHRPAAAVEAAAPRPRRAGRFLAFRIRLADRPGALAALLGRSPASART